jgi:hypothetical protein
MSSDLPSATLRQDLTGTRILFQNGIGYGGPFEGLRLCVALSYPSLDRGFEIIVTISTDDVLIFGQGVSEESLNLFVAGLFDADELEAIRLTGHVDRYSTEASPGLVSTEADFGGRPADRPTVMPASKGLFTSR